MTFKIELRWDRPQRMASETAELSLVRMGRFVILASFPVAFGEYSLYGFPALALAMIALYVGFLIAYRTAIRTRRFEAVALAAIAVALAALYVGAAIPLWGTGPDIGSTVEQWER